MPTPLQLLILPLVVAFVTTFLLVPQVRRFAIEWRLGDKPNGRKLHAHAIPHLGGIAIFGGFFLALLVSLGLPIGAQDVGRRVLGLLPSLLILFGLGLVDDLRGLRAAGKLLYQLLGASLVVAMGLGFQGAPEGAFPLLVAWSVFWYVGICNSVNLIDGLDGLAAGTSVISALAFAFVGFSLGEPAVVLVSLSLAGALLAFLRFNFHPARIFMGDTGSMFIGFTLATLACLLTPKLGLVTSVLGSVAILGVPIMDTATAILRRLLARRHIFQADGEHTHHNLMRLGLSHRGSVLLLYVLSLVFGLLGTGIFAGNPGLFFVAVALAAVTSGSIQWLAKRRLPLQPTLPAHASGVAFGARFSRPAVANATLASGDESGSVDTPKVVPVPASENLHPVPPVAGGRH